MNSAAVSSYNMGEIWILQTGGKLQQVFVNDSIYILYRIFNTTPNYEHELHKQK